jgi:hypothetical protein
MEIEGDQGKDGRNGLEEEGKGKHGQIDHDQNGPAILFSGIIYFQKDLSL